MCDEENPNWYLDFDQYKTVVTAVEDVMVQYSCFDPMTPQNLHAVNEETGEEAMPGGGLLLESPYRFAFYLRTMREEYLLPEYFTGRLKPQGMPAQDVTFVRWPEGDHTCHPTTGLELYAYHTETTVVPIELWDYTWEEWQQLGFRSVACSLSTEPDNNYIRGVFHVSAGMSLVCLNDTTACFVPAAGEVMDFRFIYSTATGINITSDVTFNVRDVDDNLVYQEQLWPVNHEIQDPGDDSPPPRPMLYTIYCEWDGRDNIENPDHLVDPDKGPYKAWVHVNLPVLNYDSNWEEFFVVPKIDSILLTHEPDYPMEIPSGEVNLYALIRGKVDITGDPELDYRYYSGVDPFPPTLDFWDADLSSCYFWDLPTQPDDAGNQQYYLENNRRITISDIRSWQSVWWGAIDYTWYVIHDWREYHGQGAGIIHYDPFDTTAQWGNYWEVILNYPENWMIPRDSPYMRLLVTCDVLNLKNFYNVQAKQTKKDSTAHKVIFAKDFDPPGFSIVDWAISHIGVPYYLRDGYYKNPYRRIECSSFVTTTRLQAIWPREEHNYRIFRILAKDYAAGRYYYRGNYLTTETQVVQPSHGMHGYLIAFDNLGNNAGIEHVAIIDCLDFDPINRRVINAMIVHAHGDAGPVAGRVRYQYLYPEYRRNWQFTYLEWTQ
jgi:hypothetical protein